MGPILLPSAGSYAWPVKRALSSFLAVVFAVSPAMAQVRPVPTEVAAPSVTPFALNGNSVLPSPSLDASFTPTLSPSSPSSWFTSSPSALNLLTPSPVEAVASKGVVKAVAVKPSSVNAAFKASVPHAIHAQLPSIFAPKALAPAAFHVTSVELDEMFDGSLRAASVSDDDAPRGEETPSAREPLLSAKTKKRALKVAAVAVPIAAASAVFGAAAPELAVHVLKWIGQGAYWLANPFAFAFTLPQIYKMLSRRSAEVSRSMLAVGFLSTVAMSINMAYDHKDLMLYRNLAQAAGFGLMLYLQRRFARKADRPLPSKRKALLETGAAVLAQVAVLLLAGPALIAAVPGVAVMGSLLVPFQVVSGFGFTYLMYAQLTKMQRERSAGDSSPAMMWAYLGTKTIWLWSFATMMSLTTGPAWMALSIGALFIGLVWFAGVAALSRLLHAPYSFLPEKLSFAGRTLPKSSLADAVAFVALSALILALAGGGWLLFSSFLGVPAADSSRFVMYLLYSVQSLVACLATLRTLRMRREFDKK